MFGTNITRLSAAFDSCHSLAIHKKEYIFVILRVCNIKRSILYLKTLLPICMMSILSLWSTFLTVSLIDPLFLSCILKTISAMIPASILTH